MRRREFIAAVSRQHVRLNGYVLLARSSKSGCSELAS